MPRFKDLLAAIAEAGEGYPETFGDDATAAYDADIAEISEGAAAKVAAMETANAELVSANEALKAHNYDLLMQIPAPDNDAKTPEEDGEPDSDEADQYGDDFFESDEENN